MAGLSKVVLQLRHGELAPTLHCQALNPNIDFSATPFVVQQELAPWPKSNGSRIAGISSFGAGGANAHVVIEEYVAPAVTHVTNGPALIVLSARHEDRLREQVLVRPVLASGPLDGYAGLGADHRSDRPVADVGADDDLTEIDLGSEEGVLQ